MGLASLNSRVLSMLQLMGHYQIVNRKQASKRQYANLNLIGAFINQHIRNYNKLTQISSHYILFIIMYIHYIQTFVYKYQIQIMNRNSSHQFINVSQEIDLLTDKMSIFYKQSSHDYSYLQEELIIIPKDKNIFQALHFHQKSLDFSISPFDESNNQSFVVPKSQYSDYEQIKRQYGKYSRNYEFVGLEEQKRISKQREDDRIEQIRKNIQKAYRIDNQITQFYVPSTEQISDNEEQKENEVKNTHTNCYLRQNNFLKVGSKDRESQQMLELKKRRAEQLKSDQKKRLIQFSMISPKVLSH